MLRRALRHDASRLTLVLTALVLAPLVLTSSGCDERVDAQASWYDPSALLANLRPEDRREAAERVGPLDALPFYDLELRLADDQRTFELTEDVYYTNTLGQPLDELVLRVHANDVGETPQVAVAGVECVDLACQVGFDGRSAITLRFATPLAPSGRVRARVRLSGTLRHLEPSRTGLFAQAMEGMTRLGAGGGASRHGDYGLLAESEGIASLGNFYAMVAPRRDGAWVRREESTMGDLGADRVAHFRLRLRCARGSRVAVSGAVTHEESVLARRDRPGYHEVRAVAGLSRNFAIVVSPRLHAVERRVGGVVVRSWYLPEDRADGERVLDDGAHALAIFERRFGRYPYTDLDLVEAPLVGGAGGVEFSGLVTLAKMFYGSGGAGGGGPLGALGGLGGGATASMRAPMLEFVVAHEVAHQWWHGLVGSDARMHPFVDESLAQFSSITYVRDRHGEARAQQEARRQVASGYHMMRMSGEADGPVDRPVAAFPSELSYAGLVYGKGGFVYERLRERLGDEAFFRGVQAYVAEHRFREAAPRALFDRLATGASAPEVRGLERRWLEEAHGDEDLGAPDPTALLADWMPTGGLGNLGGMLEQLLGGALGGAGAAPNAPAPPNAGTPADGDAALQDALRLLRQLGR